MIKTVEEYMERYHMVEEGDTIIAGVSGGADSVCLFYVLKEYCMKKQATLAVVHFNHGIRPDAGKDAEFVKTLCEESGVPFYLYEKSIPMLAKQWGVGTEEAGRLARYEAFEEVRSKYGERGKIAVAHNRNDQAETTLFHLFRGSSVAGLSGILPVREHIIRPLLCLERKEIEQYLTENEKNWCIDSTNEENTYTRNKLRNVVFPYVEKEVCEQAVSHVANAAEEIAQVRSFLEEVTAEAEKNVLIKEPGVVKIQIDAFQNLHEVIQKQLILKALEHLIFVRKDLGAVHVRDILSLFKKNSGKQIQLPYGVVASRDFGQVVLCRIAEDNVEKKEYALSIPGKVEFEKGKWIDFSLISKDNSLEIPQKTYTKWFDYDKIDNRLTLRNRRTGDYLTVNAEGGRKSIKEYFIGEKVSRTERDRKWLLADGDHILWVIGMRISEYYKVTESTKRILQITIFETEES